jgi:hypothetical protein
MALTGLRGFRARLLGGGLAFGRRVAAGAAANTNITVTGIKPGDQIISCYEMQPPTAGSGSAVVADRASEVKVTAVNTIQLTTTATTGNQLDVFWLSVKP